jgi:hypothetical protein
VYGEKVDEMLTEFNKRVRTERSKLEEELKTAHSHLTQLIQSHCERLNLKQDLHSFQISLVDLARWIDNKDSLAFEAIGPFTWGLKSTAVTQPLTTRLIALYQLFTRSVQPDLTINLSLPKNTNPQINIAFKRLSAIQKWLDLELNALKTKLKRSNETLERLSAESDALRSLLGIQSGPPGSSAEMLFQTLKQKRQHKEPLDLNQIPGACFFIELLKQNAMSTNFVLSESQLTIGSLIESLNLASVYKSPLRGRTYHISAVILRDLGVWSPWTFQKFEAEIRKQQLPAMNQSGLQDWIDQHHQQALELTNQLISDQKGPIQTEQFILPDLAHFLEVPFLSADVSEIKRAEHVKELLKLYGNSLSKDSVEHLREDHTPTVFVIDSPEAHELDDGISIEPIYSEGEIKDHWIHVHVADPTSYLAPDHPISLIAQTNISSVYLPERHCSMIPDSLNRTLFSLKKDARALTFSIRLSANGEITEYKIRPTILRNVQITSYAQVDTHLNWERAEKVAIESLSPWERMHLSLVNKNRRTAVPEHSLLEYQSLLQTLQFLTNRHFEHRLNKGLISSGYSTTYSVKVSRNEQQQPVVFLDPYSNGTQFSPANQLVSECMIMAGRVAAHFCQIHQIPTVYRGCLGIDTTQFGDLDHVLQKRNAIGQISMLDWLSIRKYLQKATDSSDPMPHALMGINGSLMDKQNAYVRVTSPMRRFCDFMVHHQIKAQLLQTCYPFKQAPREVDTRSLDRVGDKIWVQEWIRRRELWNKVLKQDPCERGIKKDEAVQRVKSSIGLGPIEQSGNPERFWKSMAEPNSPLYTGTVVSVMPKSAVQVHELGGFMANIRLKGLVPIGEQVQFKVMKVDPSIGHLTFIQV